MSPTLPGTIPGLLRRGSPVVFLNGDYGKWKAVVVAEVNGHFVHARMDPSDDGEEWGNVNYMPGVPRQNLLDLADATGRAHASWWLARHALHLFLAQATAARFVHDAGERSWSIEHPEEGALVTFAAYGDALVTAVAALAHLDPNDPRLLPDGSRWIDAEALRLVVLHVAGVTDE